MLLTAYSAERLNARAWTVDTALAPLALTPRCAEHPPMSIGLTPIRRLLLCEMRNFMADDRSKVIREDDARINIRDYLLWRD